MTGIKLTIETSPLTAGCAAERWHIGNEEVGTRPSLPALGEPTPPMSDIPSTVLETGGHRGVDALVALLCQL